MVLKAEIRYDRKFRYKWFRKGKLIFIIGWNELECLFWLDWFGRGTPWFELPVEEIGERWAAFCFVACPRSALPFVILEHNWQAQQFFMCRFFPLVGQNPRSNFKLAPPCCNHLAALPCSCVKWEESIICHQLTRLTIFVEDVCHCPNS